MAKRKRDRQHAEADGASGDSMGKRAKAAKRSRELPGDDAPREVEMKLAGRPEAIEALLDHPLVAASEKLPGQGGDLHAIYFDTGERSLREAGLSLRVRRTGDTWIQTLKAERGTRGAVLDRSEWEAEVPGPALDLGALDGAASATILADREVRERIRPAFTVRTDRRAFAVERGKAQIELVLDRAEVEVDGRSMRFGEVELEVKRGKPKALFGLALELTEAAPLHLSLATKSERGYALLGKDTPKPVKAEKLALTPGMSSAAAFQTVARSCLAQALRNEAIVRDHRLPEALHQFRVGLRRLRAAASLFSDLLGDAESRLLRADLRWVNHALGPVRDLDVLVVRLRETPDHEQALAAAERRRAEAYDELMVRLDEPRFRRTLLATAAWIEAGQWLTRKDPDLGERRDETIGERAAAVLTKRRKRVLKLAKGLEDLDPEARHKVRIEIKKLRYGAEFFGDLFTGRKAKDRRKGALKAMAELQEALGELNDIAVGGHLLAPADPDPAAQPDHERRVEDLLREAAELRRSLAGTKPFWK